MRTGTESEHLHADVRTLSQFCDVLKLTACPSRALLCLGNASIVGNVGQQGADSAAQLLIVPVVTPLDCS
jgi:hypothetical protein